MWTPAGGLQIVHTDSAEAAGVSALLSRALADSGINGITDGTSDAPLNQRCQSDNRPISVDPRR